MEVGRIWVGQSSSFFPTLLFNVRVTAQTRPIFYCKTENQTKTYKSIPRNVFLKWIEKSQSRYTIAEVLFGQQLIDSQVEYPKHPQPYTKRIFFTYSFPTKFNLNI